MNETDSTPVYQPGEQSFRTKAPQVGDVDA